MEELPYLISSYELDWIVIIFFNTTNTFFKGQPERGAFVDGDNWPSSRSEGVNPVDEDGEEWVDWFSSLVEMVGWLLINVTEIEALVCRGI